MTSRHDKMVAAAVWLAKQGAIIGWGSAQDGKAVARKWKNDMTADPVMVPPLLAGGHNSVIVPTGRMVIIDVDKFGWYERLAAQGLPPTFTLQSPTVRRADTSEKADADWAGETFRGRHVYVNAPEGYDVTTVPGVWQGGETRRSQHGEQSMVLGPWSQRADGVYEPLDDAPRTLAEVPASLLDWLIAHKGKKPGTNGVHLVVTGTDEGEWTWDGAMGSRHDHLRDRIRAWRGFDDDPASLMRRAQDYIERHRIPVSRPGGIDIDEAEIGRMVKGALEKYSDDPPKSETITAEATVTASSGEEETVEFVIDPLDIETAIERPEPLDMTKASMPTGLAMLLDHLTPITDAPFSSLALASVVCLAGLMGKGPTLRWRGTQRLILFGALVGDSNYARKGQTISEVTATLSQIDPLLDSIKEPYIPSSGPSFIDTLVETKDTGVLMVTTEMGRVLANAARQNETLSYDMRDAWDGIPIGGRTRGAGKASVSGYHLDIMGATTPEDLVAKLTETDLRNGWANRWLWFWAEKDSRPFDEERENKVDPATKAFVRDGIEFARGIAGSYLIAPAYTMTLSSEASSMLAGISRSLDVPAHGTIGVLRQRMPPIAVRIAMVAACLDQTRVIETDHLRFGFAMTDYAVQSIRAVFGTRVSDPVAQIILDVLRQSPDGWLNTSTIAKALHKSGDRVNRALHLLTDAGLIVREPRTTGGRPAIGYRLRAY